MDDGLSQFATEHVAGFTVPIISRRQVLPYDDVSALGWDSEPAQISPDLLSAFAVLVGQSGQQGKLINATKYGFLETAAQVNYTAKAARDDIVGATTLMIDDPVFGASDTPIQIFPGPTNPNPTHGPYFITARSDPRFIDLNTPIVVQVKAGDVLMAMPQVDLFGSQAKVNLLTQLVQTALGVVNPFDANVMATTTRNGHRRLAVDKERSCDEYNTTGLVQPGAATLVFGPYGVGFRAVLHRAKWSVLNNSGAASTPVVQVWDGNAGTGTLKHDDVMFMPAAQSQATCDLTDAKIASSDNGKLTLTYDRSAANLFEIISAGVHVEG